MKFEGVKNETNFDDSVRLTQNLLQLHWAEHGTYNETSIYDSIDSASDDFRKWFNSPEGKRTIEDYVKSHSKFEIEACADMELLERFFEEYCDRTPH